MRARTILGTFLLMALALSARISNSQTPQGFNYQAVIRNGSGTPIANQNISLQVTLQRASGTAYYTEQKSVTSNAQGVVAYNVGSGVATYGQFDTIPWRYGDFYIKVEIDPAGGTTYTQMGVPTKIESVPYALYADNTKEVTSLATAGDDDPIFVVKNKTGQIVFAVYQTGVRVYVEDSQITKGVRGGFAIGGLTNQSKGQQEYFRITADSARIYVKENPTVKGVRGGFAIGGLTNQSKTVTSRDLMFIATDSARIYIDETNPKGVRGGFAIGGLTNQSKGGTYNLFKVSKDSTRIYVNENPIKGARGGFAIGGLTNQSKANTGQFLNLTPDNYFIGQDAGKSITTGEYNSFMGYHSGQANTVGSRNVFLGFNSGYSNIWGKENIFIGNSSGYNTEGVESSDAGSYNIFLGTNSGYHNTTGSANLFIGNASGIFNTTGTENIFLGQNAGFHSLTGSYNLFFGTTAGFDNTSGQSNVLIGYRSGTMNTTGNSNTFIGSETGLSNTTGSFNVAIGKYAGYFMKLGDNNTLVGSMAGSTPIGSGNVLIGYYAITTDSLDNQLVITNTPVSNPLIWGDFANNKLNFTADVGIGTKTPEKRLHVVGDAKITGDIYYGTGVVPKPDFVFKPEYTKFLDPLSVEKYISNNGHLPWITKASDETDGINLTRMQLQTVETVENLQLQIINQQKEIETLKAELEAIKKLITK